MEERIVDDEKSRKIALKRTDGGETDAVEAGASDNAGADGLGEGEETAEMEFPDDEELVGLSPAETREVLEKREKARREAIAECLKSIAAGDELYAAGDFSGAESAYSDACVYDPDNAEAAEKLFKAATKGFTETDPLFEEDRAETLRRLPAGRAAVLREMGGKLREERIRDGAEADALRGKVEEARGTRREAFAANRKHYTVLTCVCVFLVAVFAVATAISIDNLFRTENGTAPIALSIIFGALAFLSFAAAAVFGAKLYGAHKLCAMNEKPDSTKDGARLVLLETRLKIMDLLLSDNADGDEADESNGGQG